MIDWKLDLWEEGLSQSFEEHGVTVTTEQLRLIAKDVIGFSEEMGQASYVPENPLISELAEATAQLRNERAKKTCNQCGGTGEIVEWGPCHSARSRCWQCGGEGRHL